MQEMWKHINKFRWATLVHSLRVQLIQYRATLTVNKALWIILGLWIAFWVAPKIVVVHANLEFPYNKLGDTLGYMKEMGYTMGLPSPYNLAYHLTHLWDISIVNRVIGTTLAVIILGLCAYIECKGKG